MQSRVTCLLLLLAVLAVSACAQSAAETVVPSIVPLPAAKTDGAFALEKALHQRRSVRDLASSALSLNEIGQLCWAAQGVTDASGRRTTPSAMARYPLELYVLVGSANGLASGMYHYLPAKHQLELIDAGDRLTPFRKQAAKQAWIAKAPVVFVITGFADRMTGMGDRGRDFMWVEAGLASQGFFLQATALGLGSTYVGGYDPAAARASLGLPANQDVLAVLPVGRRP